jgi:hypothetical protein
MDTAITVVACVVGSVLAVGIARDIVLFVGAVQRQRSGIDRLDKYC